MAYADRILALLHKQSGKTDREIAEALDGPGTPQQGANAACRRLETNGLIVRKQRYDGLIGNYVASVPRVPLRDNPKPVNRSAKQFAFDKPVLHEKTTVALKFGWFEAGKITANGNEDIYIPPLPDQSGLYRFWFTETQSCYVGESKNIRKRLYFYRKPGPSQATNVWMNQHLKLYLASHQFVRLDLCLEAYVNDGTGTVRADMNSNKIRRLIENAAVVSAASKNCEVLNK